MKSYLQSLINLFSTNSSYILIGVISAALFILFFIKLKNLRKNNLRKFLYSNDYTSIDPKSNEVIYPNLIYKVDRVILKNCHKKSFKQVLEDREKWEKFLNRKILDARDENNNTIIYLE